MSLSSHRKSMHNMPTQKLQTKNSNLPNQYINLQQLAYQSLENHSTSYPPQISASSDSDFKANLLPLNSQRSYRQNPPPSQIQVLTQRSIANEENMMRLSPKIMPNKKVTSKLTPSDQNNPDVMIVSLNNPFRGAQKENRPSEIKVSKTQLFDSSAQKCYE